MHMYSYIYVDKVYVWKQQQFPLHSSSDLRSEKIQYHVVVCFGAVQRERRTFIMIKFAEKSR